ncbi:unnamed protein product [Paramecium primaurelia]|uniref:Uncharacterized protein n=1 Tax=Paramecium primaurelia TaxID=5886 RepID=A0A8S1NSQ1_PARPR|nr:unnamed protein product [Paramecium primaurelia]
MENTDMSTLLLVILLALTPIKQQLILMWLISNIPLMGQINTNSVLPHVQSANIMPIIVQSAYLLLHQVRVYNINEIAASAIFLLLNAQHVQILIRNIYLHHHHVIANPSIILIVLSYGQNFKNHVMNVIQTVVSTANIQIKFSIPINSLFANLDIFHKGLYDFNVKIHVLQVLIKLPNAQHMQIKFRVCKIINVQVKKGFY